jgi:hypothetical protein
MPMFSRLYVLLVDETVASQGLGKTPPPKFVITGSQVRIL